MNTQSPTAAANPSIAPVWSQLDVNARDRRYWEALCAWPAAARWNAVRDGIDHGHLVRSLLWDKVGRAIRGAVSADAAAFELQWLGRESTPAKRHISPPPPEAGLRGRLREARAQWRRRLRGQPLLFCPFPYARHARVIGSILEQLPGIAVGLPVAHASKWPGCVPLAVPGAEPDARQSTRVRELGRAIAEGLATQAVILGESDRQRLEQELAEQQTVLADAVTAIDALRPTAVLLPADNHSPFIEYALVARQRRIPTIMLQHGLDCERFTLDEAYASHIAVWGSNRAERYRHDSTYQPVDLEIVGNPHYDDWPQLVPNSGEPANWLWVTRPHRPEKCHLPSRRPDEGLRILDALLTALDAAPHAHLTIKAHPFDYESAYRERVHGSYDSRVTIVQDTLQNLLPKCRVVITEDSTAGMDAMFAGRFLVHAHFTESKPVMPFVAYGAALPGFSATDMVVALNGPRTNDSLRTGQTRFLNDFAGPCDGQATRRFAEFVGRCLNRR